MYGGMFSYHYIGNLLVSGGEKKLKIGYRLAKLEVID